MDDPETQPCEVGWPVPILSVLSPGQREGEAMRAFRIGTVRTLGVFSNHNNNNTYMHTYIHTYIHT